METPFHRLPDLFRQLGLPDEASAIDAFIATHRPLPAGVSLCDASFWTPMQAQFLREQIRNDADWSELVDTLSERLSRRAARHGDPVRGSRGAGRPQPGPGGAQNHSHTLRSHSGTRFGRGW
jgi:hypothetical protein